MRYMSKIHYRTKSALFAVKFSTKLVVDTAVEITDTNLQQNFAEMTCMVHDVGARSLAAD